MRSEECSPASLDSGFFSGNDGLSLASPVAGPSIMSSSSSADACNRPSQSNRSTQRTPRPSTSVPLKAPSSLSRIERIISNTSSTVLLPRRRFDPFWSLSIFAAEMVVWLWFEASANQKGKAIKDPLTVLKDRVSPTERFLAFCHNVITTTQVSHSVVVLSLLFIARLKSQNDISGAPGSEYRLLITALMLANKVLDDNTYTAKTWADVSSLELGPLVAGESEFLRGLDWQLHIDSDEFDGWTRLLEGHVSARRVQVDNLSTIRRSERLSQKAGYSGADANMLTQSIALLTASSPPAKSSFRQSSFSRESAPMESISRPMTRAFAQQVSQQGQPVRPRMKRTATIEHEQQATRPTKRFARQDSMTGRPVAPPTPRSFGAQSPEEAFGTSTGQPTFAAHQIPSSASGLAIPFSPFAPGPAFMGYQQPEALSYYALAAGQGQGIKHETAVMPVVPFALPPSGYASVNQAGSSTGRRPSTMASAFLPTPSPHPHDLVRPPAAFGPSTTWASSPSFVSYPHSAPNHSPVSWFDSTHQPQAFAKPYLPSYRPFVPAYSQPTMMATSYANAGPPGYVYAAATGGFLPVVPHHPLR